jgi:hypothetical protein
MVTRRELFALAGFRGQLRNRGVTKVIGALRLRAQIVGKTARVVPVPHRRAALRGAQGCGKRATAGQPALVLSGL